MASGEMKHLDDHLPESAPKPGELFAGKYRIERVLGVGGMGYVLAAEHVHLKERVAIKLLLPERAKQPDTVARFLREGRAAVKIRSEHVARVLDVGTEDDVPYLVMEYLDGQDLAVVLAERKRLPIATAVDYVLQACEAIAEAHAMQTIHRDLKPANLFLVRRADDRECVKVLDFGISKTHLDGDDVGTTKTTTTVGTPLYMSPEQLTSSKHVDARTDIWALGVILFELLAGQPPFAADTIAELGALVLTSAPPDLRTLTPEAPAALAEVVARCLRRNVGERFPSLAELAEALAPFGTDEAGRSARSIARVLEGVPRPATTRPGNTPVSLSATAASTTDGTWGTRTQSAGGGQGTPTRKRWTPAVVGGTILAVVAVGVGAGAGVRRLASSPASTSASASDGVESAIPSASTAAAPQPSSEPSPPTSTSTSTDPVVEAPPTVDSGAPTAPPLRKGPKVGHVPPPSPPEKPSAAIVPPPATPTTAAAPPSSAQPAAKTTGPKHRIDPTNPYNE